MISEPRPQLNCLELLFKMGNLFMILEPVPAWTLVRLDCLELLFKMGVREIALNYFSRWVLERLP